MTRSPAIALRAAAPLSPMVRTRWSLNRVGGKAFTIVDVVDVGLLVRSDTNTAQQINVDGNRSFVVQATGSDRCAVEFCFKHGYVHNFTLLCRSQKSQTPLDTSVYKALAKMKIYLSV